MIVIITISLLSFAKWMPSAMWFIRLRDGDQSRPYLSGRRWVSTWALKDGEMLTKIEIWVCEGGGGLFSEQKLEMRRKKNNYAYWGQSWETAWGAQGRERRSEVGWTDVWPDCGVLPRTPAALCCVVMQRHVNSTTPGKPVRDVLKGNFERSLFFLVSTFRVIIIFTYKNLERFMISI